MLEMLLGNSKRRGEVAPAGQIEFIKPGTYSWIVPEGVYSISGVAIGGGGGRYSYTSEAGGGGGGGGLAWFAEQPVTPGEILTITVGAAGKNGGLADVTSGTASRIRSNLQGDFAHATGGINGSGNRTGGRNLVGNGGQGGKGGTYGSGS